MPPLSVNTSGPVPSEAELRHAARTLDQSLQDFSLMRSAIFTQLRHVRKELSVCRDPFDRISWEAQEKTLAPQLENIDLQMGLLCAERYRVNRLLEQLGWQRRQAELRAMPNHHAFSPVRFEELRPYASGSRLLSALGTGSTVIVMGAS